MSETLGPLIAAGIAFVGSHFLLSARPVRDRLIGLAGRWGFMAVYAAVALAAFVWMNLAYASAPVIELWPRPDWAWWLSLAAMPLAAILLVCGFLTPNPTAWFGAGLLARADPAPGIFKVTRHPVMWAVALWAILHMPATGDASSQIFFAAIALLALGGARHIDARRAREGGAGWERFAARTSFVPFAAALAGRTRISLGEIGWARIALGIAFYLILLQGHEWVIGVPVAPWALPPAGPA